MRKSGIIIAITFILLFPVLSFAQLTVVPTHPAATLAAKLAGPGISISSPVLTCAGVANGTFVSVLTPITIDSGVILTSGRAINTSGLESFLASTNNGTPGDAALTVLAGTATNDACTLEFDFIPKGDTVSFNYQFGSEEYVNSTCGQYNDAFAFFISGPGIVGAQNIALVPGTNIPVTVNSINSGVPGPAGWPGFCDIANCTSMGPGSPFTTYFVNNTGGTQVTYKGYTTKLRAYHSVTPCSTYHLKMSVADASNSLYDSGVFIEAGSLTTNSYVFKKTDSIGHTINGTANAIVRGCDSATITVLNSRVTGTPQKVYFSYGGTAVHGVDFTAPDSAFVNPGDTSVVIGVIGVPSAPTGPQTIFIYLSSPFSCGIIDTISLTLLDAPTMAVITPDTTICLGQSFQLRVAGSGGLVYGWTPPGSLSSPTAMEPVASPVVNTIYTVSATLPLSGCTPLLSSVNVTVNMAAMNIITPDTTICIGDDLPIYVSGTAGLVYSWLPAGTLNAPNAQNPIATPLVSTTYTLSAVSAIDGCKAVDSVRVTVLDPSISIVNANPSICYGKKVKLLMTGDPAYTTYSYSWTPATDLDDATLMEPTASPLFATTYSVVATVPVYGCTTSAVTTVVLLPQVFAHATARKPVCLDEPAELIAAPRGDDYLYQWVGPDGFSSTLSNPFIKRSRIESEGIYSVVVTDITTGCDGTDTAYVTVGGASLLLTNVTADQTIRLGSSIQLGADGGVSYMWLPNDGSLSNPNINNPIATPKETTTYTVIAFDSIGCKNIDTVRIDVDAPSDVFIPSAFTPNGDGLNDVFRMTRSNNYTLVEMRVYDRWGKQVCLIASNDSRGWDGTVNGIPADMGTYNYLFVVTDQYGVEKVLKGNVTLIR